MGDTSLQRHDHARHASGNTAIEGYGQGASQTSRHQSKDRRQMEGNRRTHCRPEHATETEDTVIPASLFQRPALMFASRVRTQLTILARPGADFRETPKAGGGAKDDG